MDNKSHIIQLLYKKYNNIKVNITKKVLNYNYAFHIIILIIILSVMGCLVSGNFIILFIMTGLISVVLIVEKRVDIAINRDIEDNNKLLNNILKLQNETCEGDSII